MKKIIMDYCLLHQMNTFGPNFFKFSCMGKKVPFAGILHAYEEAPASSVKSHQPVTFTNYRYCSGSLADGGVAAHVAAFV